MGIPRCPAGHPLASARRRFCLCCRRDGVLEQVAAATSLPRAQVASALDAVATHPAVLRSLAAALEADPDALAHGAPPVVGRLVTELIGRGATGLPVPACVVCGRVGRPLTRTDSGGMCQRCAARRNPLPCARCGIVKPVAGRTAQMQPICERCRRGERGRRACGRCGKVASIAVRARDGQPDVCVNCYRLPEAVCSVCGRHRECGFAASQRPICLSCLPRASVPCGRCGADRPPTARWEEGPVCERCYTAALRHRGRCQRCAQTRRLVAPPGPDADTCADCVGQPITHACGDCGLEDKLFEKGRCAGCSLRRRATDLLSAGSGHVPTQLSGVLEAICATRTPRTALNWLREGAAAAVLAEVASGRLEPTHRALDAHPNPRAADYLRHVLVAGGALGHRDEDLARTERWLEDQLAAIEVPAQRQLVKAFATWRVMRRLRRSAEATPGPRTYTAHAKANIKAAAEFLAWLDARDLTLAQARQGDIEHWLTTSSRACRARDFLTWAAERGYCHAFEIPSPKRSTGIATHPDQRWALVARLLHDDDLAVIDRVAGCLVLLFGQQISRIAAMTTDQIIVRDDHVFVRLGEHDVPVPEPLEELLQRLVRDPKSHIGIGTPVDGPWLLPGGMPGRPITASRLAERLRALGINTQAGRRAALLDLAAQLPAAVLADLLGLHTTTAVGWTRQTGGDWNRYAAQLARTRHHQPGE